VAADQPSAPQQLVAAAPPESHLSVLKAYLMAEQQQGVSGDASKPGISLGSFSIKGKARAKVTVNAKQEQEDRQIITAVTEDGTIQTAGPAAGSGSKQYVVPALKNTYKTGVGKFVPSFVPEASSAAVQGNAEDRFERAEVGHAPTLSTFGLEVRGPKRDAADAGGAANGAAAGAAAAAAGSDRPLVAVQSRAEEAAQLKDDLENLPDESTVEVSWHLRHDGHGMCSISEEGSFLSRSKACSQGRLALLP
jgi:hypothetical protein